MEVRTRFAPSPTGSMHIGNVRTAAFAWLFARHHGGQMILRIEDTDRQRYVPGAEEEILDGLRWLSLDFDEGPYRQSERLDLYKAYADDLIGRKLAYRCWCSPERLTDLRESQRAAGQPTGYDRHCRESSHGRSLDDPHVIRFAMPVENATSFFDEVRGEITFDNALLDDFVMLKTDGFPTYQFANVVDDHEMGITHVIRSDEWVSSTPKHVQLYKAFGWKPPRFAHPPLILGPDRSKLAKRHGAVSFKEYTMKGYLPDALLNFMALLGWSPGDDREVLKRQELIDLFDIPGIVVHPAVFDTQKLDWINRQHIRMLGAEELVKQARRLPEVDALVAGQDPQYVKRVTELLRERLNTLDDLKPFGRNFFVEDFAFEEKGTKWFSEPAAAELFTALISALETVEWNEEAIETAVRDAGSRVGREGGNVIHPMRVACTGRTAGPSLFATLEVLGRDRVLARLARAVTVSKEPDTEDRRG